MSALRMTVVSRQLDRKLQVFGFEVFDIMAIFFLLSVLNFVLGPLGQRLLLVWVPTGAFASVLWFGKRDKPDNYLVHFGRFHLKPRYYSAFQWSTLCKPYPYLKTVARNE